MSFQLRDYYLGLDMGTDSVGWAVTDKDYNLYKFNGKFMWGTHLFAEGNSAEARRLFRTNTRRLNRQKFRLLLLRELFEEEVLKIDSDFFQRLDESKFWKDDKTIAQSYTLFNDKDYTDVQYHKEFPTIYHLRNAIIDNPSKKFNIRLIYLAIASILKHRGHFLLAGQSFSLSDSYEEVIASFNSSYREAFEGEFCDKEKYSEIRVILSEKNTKTNKKKELSLFTASKEFAALLVGCSVKLEKLFDDELLADEEIKSIDLSAADYDEKQEQYRAILEDRMDLIDAAKQVYDWSVLNRILGGNKSLSEAKIQSYEKHKKDLSLLKKIIKNNCAREVYNSLFKDSSSKNNYCAYIGQSTASENSSVCSANDFYKCVKDAISEVNDEIKEKAYILSEIENGTFCPKQVTNENGVIPYQLHLDELKRILENSGKYYNFFNKTFSDGTTVSSRILSIMTFKIPYYVGPLNPAHKDDKRNGHAWIVKKTEEKIRPWNFDEVVDLTSSGESFIRRMTSRCTYLIDCDVLPKDSLIYSKFTMLNEINTIKVNGCTLDVQTKQDVFNSICKTKATIKLRDIKKYLVSISKASESDVIEGADESIKASLKSFRDFSGILEKNEWNEAKIESSILTLVLFNGEKKLIAERLNKIWGDTISKEKLNKISGFRYSGWGRLSKEFLSEIYHINKETGEAWSIITALYETNNNLMQLLSTEYDYARKIEEHNAEVCRATDTIDYESIVESLYCSPAVKRSIWRTLSIVQEITKIAKNPPAKIIIEVAREEGEKKRTVSRKAVLLELYKNCKKEMPELYEALGKQSDGDLRSDKLYLYYTQLGHCMYSGERIELSELLDDNKYDVDHIYPRSKTKDNSIENRVLVKKNLNAEKADFYPLPSNFQNEKTRSLWKRLLEMGLIGKTKYERLVRTTEFSNDELAGFISRQLVETRQSTKAVAHALGAVFSEDKTEIVYVKAGHVSDFRQDNNFVKVREINDIHHAKDAYLNIVVGNVYNTKFTKNPVNYIKEAQARSYSLNRMYDYDVKRGSETAWIPGGNGTIKTVKKTMQQNRIQFTRYAYVANGEFYKQMPLKKGHGQIPLKSKDDRLHDISRYGGYNADATACFFLVEHKMDNERVRTIEYLPIRWLNKVNCNPSALLEFCKMPLPFGLGLHEPRILLERIKIDSLLIIDGFPTHVSGRSGSAITLKPAVQIYIDEETEGYLKKVVKFVERCKSMKIEPETATNFDFVTAEENLRVYDNLLSKQRDTIYSLRPASQVKTLENGRDKFKALGVYKQCYVLTQMLILTKCVFRQADLTNIGGSGRAGAATRDKRIEKYDSVKLVNQSVTGLFSNTVDLLKL